MTEDNTSRNSLIPELMVSGVILRIGTISVLARNRLCWVI